jgi:hypothetical protein
MLGWCYPSLVMVWEGHPHNGRFWWDLVNLDVEHLLPEDVIIIICGSLLTDSDRMVMRQKSWKLLNWDALVVCLNMDYEKAVTIIDPVAMHQAHWWGKPSSYIKYGRALLWYTQMTANRSFTWIGWLIIYYMQGGNRYNSYLFNSFFKKIWWIRKF